MINNQEELKQVCRGEPELKAHLVCNEATTKGRTQGRSRVSVQNNRRTEGGTYTKKVTTDVRLRSQARRASPSQLIDSAKVGNEEKSSDAEKESLFSIIDDVPKNFNKKKFESSIWTFAKHSPEYNYCSHDIYKTVPLKEECKLPDYFYLIWCSDTGQKPQHKIPESFDIRMVNSFVFYMCEIIRKKWSLMEDKQLEYVISSFVCAGFKDMYFHYDFVHLYFFELMEYYMHDICTKNKFYIRLMSFKPSAITARGAALSKAVKQCWLPRHKIDGTFKGKEPKVDRTEVEQKANVLKMPANINSPGVYKYYMYCKRHNITPKYKNGELVLPFEKQCGKHTGKYKIFGQPCHRIGSVLDCDVPNCDAQSITEHAENVVMYRAGLASKKLSTDDPICVEIRSNFVSGAMCGMSDYLNSASIPGSKEQKQIDGVMEKFYHTITDFLDKKASESLSKIGQTLRTVFDSFVKWICDFFIGAYQTFVSMCDTMRFQVMMAISACIDWMVSAYNVSSEHLTQIYSMFCIWAGSSYKDFSKWMEKPVMPVYDSASNMSHDEFITEIAERHKFYFTREYTPLQWDHYSTMGTDNKYQGSMDICSTIYQVYDYNESNGLVTELCRRAFEIGRFEGGWWIELDSVVKYVMSVEPCQRRSFLVLMKQQMRVLWIQRKSTFEKQGSHDAIARIIATIFSSFMDDPKSYKLMYGIFSNSGFAVESCSKAFYKFMSHTTGDDTWTMGKLALKIKDFVSDVSILSANPSLNSDLLGDPKTMSLVRRLQRDETEIKILIASEDTKSSPSIRQFELCGQRLAKMVEKLVDPEYLLPRYRPCWTSFIGPSQHGKSLLTGVWKKLCWEYLKAYGLTKSLGPLSQANVYPFDGKEFWEAYRNQEIVILDECLSYIGMDQNIFDTCLMLLKMVDSQPFTVNKANMAEKDNTYFGSKVLISNSNRNFETWKRTMMADQNAVPNRGLFVYVYKKNGIESVLHDEEHLVNDAWDFCIPLKYSTTTDKLVSLFVREYMTILIQDRSNYDLQVLQACTEFRKFCDIDIRLWDDEITQRMEEAADKFQSKLKAVNDDEALAYYEQIATYHAPQYLPFQICRVEGQNCIKLNYSKLISLLSLSIRDMATGSSRETEVSSASCEQMQEHARKYDMFCPKAFVKEVVPPKLDIRTVTLDLGLVEDKLLYVEREVPCDCGAYKEVHMRIAGECREPFRSRPISESFFNALNYFIDDKYVKQCGNGGPPCESTDKLVQSFPYKRYLAGCAPLYSSDLIAETGPSAAGTRLIEDFNSLRRDFKVLALSKGIPEFIELYKAVIFSNEENFGPYLSYRSAILKMLAHELEEWDPLACYKFFFNLERCRYFDDYEKEKDSYMISDALRSGFTETIADDHIRKDIANRPDTCLEFIFHNALQALIGSSVTFAGGAIREWKHYKYWGSVKVMTAWIGVFCLATLAFGAVVAGAAALYQYATNPVENIIMTPQSQNMATMIRQKEKHQQHLRATGHYSGKGYAKQFVRSDSISIDQSFEKQVSSNTISGFSKILCNTCKLTVDGPSGRRTSEVWFISSSEFITVGHMFDLSWSKAYFTKAIYEVMERGNVEFKESDFLCKYLKGNDNGIEYNLDLCLVRIRSGSIPRFVQFKDMLKPSYLPDHIEHDLRGSNCARMFNSSTKSNIIDYIIGDFEYEFCKKPINSWFENENGERIETSNYPTILIRNGDSVKGDCGKLYGCQMNGNPRILGMHQAGGNGKCIAHPLSKQMIINARKELDDEKPDSITYCMQSLQVHPRMEEMTKPEKSKPLPGVWPMNKMGFFFAGTGGTNLHDSPIRRASYDFGDEEKSFIVKNCTVMPAIREEKLFKYDGVETKFSPWTKTDEKRMRTGTPAIHDDFVKMFQRDPSFFYEDLFGKQKRHSPRILSFYEVMAKSVYLDGANSAASLGTFGKLYPQFKDRNDIFNKERNWIHPLFLKYLEEMFELGRHGIPYTLAMQCIKDELLPIEDVVNGKARAFAVADVAVYFIVMALFGQAIFYIKENEKGPFVFGYNPHSCQVNDIFNKLDMNGNLTGEDASANDFCTVDYVAYCLIWSLTTQFYGILPGHPDYALYMNWGMTVVHFGWLRGNNVHWNLRGMQSGHPLTSLLNSYFHFICRKFVFHGLYPGERFREKVKYMGHGDDANSSVSRDCPDYNMESCAAAFLILFGMVLTSSDKKKASAPYLEDNSKMEFLSRQYDFIKVGNKKRLVHKLKKESIFGCLNYIRTDELSEFDAMQANIRVAQIEAVYHGKEFFDQLKRDIEISTTKEGYTFVIETYESMYNRWRDNYYLTDSPVVGPKYDPFYVSF